MDLSRDFVSRGAVEIAEFPIDLRAALLGALSCGQGVESIVCLHAPRRMRRHNLVFNFPRAQYAKLDRGETPESVNAQYLTLATAAYANPAQETVTGEAMRVAASTRAVDPANPNNSVVRFILDVGQFVGTWNTAILIGGAATATPGTGKIVAAVNDLKDDTGAPVSRDGTTLHLVSWKLRHIDASEV